LTLAAQLSASTGANLSGGLQGYHGAFLTGNTSPAGKSHD